MSRLSYTELQRRHRNLYKKYRYWRYRQREIERMRRYRMGVKLVAEDGVKSDIPEGEEIACRDLNEVFNK